MNQSDFPMIRHHRSWVFPLWVCNRLVQIEDTSWFGQCATDTRSNIHRYSVGFWQWRVQRLVLYSIKHGISVKINSIMWVDLPPACRLSWLIHVHVIRRPQYSHFPYDWEEFIVVGCLVGGQYWLADVTKCWQIQAPHIWIHPTKLSNSDDQIFWHIFPEDSHYQTLLNQAIHRIGR
jgi:hypothetical protein